MLQAFIITLREGVEAALIVGIALAYLTKAGRAELRKSVYAGLGAAFVGSIGLAILLSRTHWNEDIFEGWIMLAAAFFVVTMIIFMMRTGRKLKGEIEGKLGSLVGQELGLRCFLFRIFDGAAGGCGNRADAGRGFAQLNRTLELSGNPGGRDGGDVVWRDVRQRQRAHQPAEVFPGHHGNFVFRGGSAACFGTARTIGERGASLLESKRCRSWDRSCATISFFS